MWFYSMVFTQAWNCPQTHFRVYSNHLWVFCISGPTVCGFWGRWFCLLWINRLFLGTSDVGIYNIHFMCVWCMCVCSCVCRCIAWACTCRGQRLIWSVFLYHFYFIKTTTTTVSSRGLYVSTTHPTTTSATNSSFSHGRWRSGLRSSHLGSKHFIHWAILPALMVSFSYWIASREPAKSSR